MPYTEKQIRFFRANNIPYDKNAPIITGSPNPARLTKLTIKLKTNKFQIDKLKGAKKTYIVTKLNKPKEKIKIGSTTYILS